MKNLLVFLLLFVGIVAAEEPFYQAPEEIKEKKALDYEELFPKIISYGIKNHINNLQKENQDYVLVYGIGFTADEAGIGLRRKAKASLPYYQEVMINEEWTDIGGIKAIVGHKVKAKLRVKFSESWRTTRPMTLRGGTGDDDVTRIVYIRLNIYTYVYIKPKK